MTTGTDARTLLGWYVEAGADEAIGNAPVDRFAESARAATPQPEPTPRARPHVAPQARPNIAPRARPNIAPQARPARGSSAREIAAGCATLEELVAAIKAFDGCALRETATNTVIGDGNPEARVMFIGEAPGAEEDRQGLPFVGPAGRLLDRMLAAIGLDRGSAYITNILFWRPPGNRSPTADEVATCLPFAWRQIELLRPAVLAPVGGISAKALLDRSEGITRLRGVWHSLRSPDLGTPVDAVATFHPAYLLRQPSHKREAWRDLLAIKARLGES